MVVVLVVVVVVQGLRGLQVWRWGCQSSTHRRYPRSPAGTHTRAFLTSSRRHARRLRRCIDIAERPPPTPLPHTPTHRLPPQAHSLEFLRDIMHLRARTNTIGSMLRVRSTLAQAVNKYFVDQGFVQVHTPILTRWVPAWCAPPMGHPVSHPWAVLCPGCSGAACLCVSVHWRHSFVV